MGEGPWDATSSVEPAPNELVVGSAEHDFLDEHLQRLVDTHAATRRRAGF